MLRLLWLLAWRIWETEGQVAGGPRFIVVAHLVSLKAKIPSSACGTRIGILLPSYGTRTILPTYPPIYLTVCSPFPLLIPPIQ
ncbi:hypothetical protein BKA80DRAFT_61531 [Phyllosticta citrichinensis]